VIKAAARWSKGAGKVAIAPVLQCSNASMVQCSNGPKALVELVVQKERNEPNGTCCEHLAFGAFVCVLLCVFGSLANDDLALGRASARATCDQIIFFPLLCFVPERPNASLVWLSFPHRARLLAPAKLPRSGPLSPVERALFLRQACKTRLTSTRARQAAAARPSGRARNCFSIGPLLLLWRPYSSNVELGRQMTPAPKSPAGSPSAASLVFGRPGDDLGLRMGREP